MLRQLNRVLKNRSVIIMNAANNGILKRLLGNQNLTVSFSEDETGDIKANVFSLL